MTTPNTRCPSCAGLQMPNHPGGILEIQHTAHCALLTFEDATRAADYDRQGYGRFSRPATPAEVLLLTAFGFQVPAQPITVVSHLSPGVRRRTWAFVPDVA